MTTASSPSAVTFLPWLRTGLGTMLDATSPLDERASLNVELTVHARSAADAAPAAHTVGQTLAFVGPGDVRSIAPDAILACCPAPGADGTSALDVAHITFADADFPWRYTPAAPSGDTLPPWLSLVVLAEDEFSTAASTHLPAIRVDADAAPDLAHGSRWAHVHVAAGLGGADPAQFAQAHPDRVSSRLLCPRRLKAHTAYHAFLVPAFERGRLAGLGLPVAGPALARAWQGHGQGAVLPVYHRWAFSTGAAGDFETLVRALKPLAMPHTPRTIALDALATAVGVAGGDALVSTQRTALVPRGTPAGGGGGPQSGGPQGGAGSHTPDGVDASVDASVDEMAIRARADRAALARTAARGTPTRSAGLSSTAQNTVSIVDHVPVGTGPTQITPPATMADLRAGLATALDRGDDDDGDDPLVHVPPLYGQHHAGRDSASATGSTWFDTVNLDPAYRAAAGLGAAVVAAHQEDFMERAWAQIDAVRQANARLRQFQLGAAVTARLEAKHLGARDDVQMARTLAHVDPASATGVLPRAALSPALGKVARGAAGRRAVRAHGLDGDRAVDGMAGRTVSTAPLVNPGDTAPITLTPTATTVAAPALVTTLNAQDGVRAADEATAAHPWPAAQASRARFAPDTALAARAQRVVDLGPGQGAPVDGAGWPAPVLAAPSLPVPLVEHVLETDPSWVVPGLDSMPDGSLTLLDVDQAFVEALLVGANHAMAGELRWRGYPTDGRGTVLPTFWPWQPGPTGTAPDVTPLHTWPAASPLGTHGAAAPAGTHMVLALKSDVLRRYPGTQVYLHRAQWTGKFATRRRAPVPHAGAVLPAFAVQADARTMLIGFPVGVAAARGDASDAGYFVVLREKPGAVRFGLDAEAQGIPSSSNDLAWSHFQTAPGAHLTPQAVWPMPSGAHVAHALRQAPLLVGIHATDLLPGA